MRGNGGNIHFNETGKSFAGYVKYFTGIITHFGLRMSRRAIISTGKRPTKRLNDFQFLAEIRVNKSKILYYNVAEEIIIGFFYW